MSLERSVEAILNSDIPAAFEMFGRKLDAEWISEALEETQGTGATRHLAGYWHGDVSGPFHLGSRQPSGARAAKPKEQAARSGKKRRTKRYPSSTLPYGC